MSADLVEISLKQKLLQDVDELRQGREPLLEVLDQLDRSQAVGHVEADVDLDVSQPVGQLDDRNLYWQIDKKINTKSPHKTWSAAD